MLIPGYCNSITRTQATIVWYPKNTCTTFQVAKFYARTLKFYKKVLLNQSLLKKSTRIGLDLIIKSIKLLMVLKTNKNFFKFSVKQKSLVNIQNQFFKNTILRNFCQVQKKFGQENRKNKY